MKGERSAQESGDGGAENAEWAITSALHAPQWSQTI